jgi:adenylate cyclase
MKIKNDFAKKIQKVIIITVCWTLFVSFSFISQYFFVHDLINLKKLSGSYEFRLDFIGTVILGIFGGLVGGYFLVFKMGSRYRNKSFIFGIINSGLLFIAAYISFAAAGLFLMDFIYFILNMNFSSALSKSIGNVLFNIETPSFFVTMFAWAFLVSSTQFMLQVNDKFGPGVLWKFITGKYYHPREEERIFMFLDLKSSTTIAENIGNKKFFNLLKEVFNDVTEPIINSQGEIYQYVGDEIVITWPVDKGLEKNNCLQCFFRIQQVLEIKKEYYLKKYDFLPSFKAGIHIGEATVGEIGVIKKDIVFSGDVLNTTSRMQGECNNHNVDIILSSVLLSRLHLNGEYQKIPLGEIQLKGKQEKIGLNTIKANKTLSM